MVAVNQRRIRCVVVAVPAEADLFAERGALAHEMVPGADPYVALLIQRLQDEVREERRLEQLSGRVGIQSRRARFERGSLAGDTTGDMVGDMVGDMELPWFDMPLDDEPLGEEKMPEFGNEN
jgi:hypothetical protein